MSELTTPLGEMDRRLLIQQLVTGSPQQTPTGEPNQEWGTLTTVWAKITPMTARELEAAQQIAEKVDTRINMNYRADVVSGMRGTYRGIVYNFDGVIDINMRHVELLIYCSSGLNQG